MSHLEQKVLTYSWKYASEEKTTIPLSNIWCTDHSSDQTEELCTTSYSGGLWYKLCYYSIKWSQPITSDMLLNLRHRSGCTWGNEKSRNWTAHRNGAVMAIITTLGLAGEFLLTLPADGRSSARRTLLHTDYFLHWTAASPTNLHNFFNTGSLQEFLDCYKNGDFSSSQAEHLVHKYPVDRMF